jgi:hypothetical protein
MSSSETFQMNIQMAAPYTSFRLRLQPLRSGGVNSLEDCNGRERSQRGAADIGETVEFLISSHRKMTRFFQRDTNNAARWAEGTLRLLVIFAMYLGESDQGFRVDTL